MPSAAARRLYEDQIPSFMSILDPDADNFDDRGLVTMVDSKFLEVEQACTPQINQTQATATLQQQQHHHLRQATTDALHRHNDSTSTQNSESTDSSPTTTLTTDTSSLSDPSPSSSPDSPINLIPLNQFPGTSFGGLPATMNSLSINDSPSSSRERPMTSPSPRRARNMKGLSIQPPSAGSLSSNLISEPSSPSFIKPRIPGMKRKPSQLSLKTDSNDLRPSLLDVPGSPSLPPILQRRSLKHSTSSPHMLTSLRSATFGPVGGMTFPTVLERGESGLSEILRPSKQGGPTVKPRFGDPIMEEDSPIRPQVANRSVMDFEPFHDESEVNEDQKSPGYPDGPIAIYEDNVYLYLEPTAEEAAKFDVVINVAREVLNPFQESDKQPTANAQPVVESPIPDTAVTTDSFSTAFEFPAERAETPTTPKATASLHEPEYIHMPWDHNTDIATDLMMLCETIERRTKEGKRVLVHCQQGASRSASLIIAYGLYQNPGMSVNDAYYRAQSKSRWISPNMRLMYCLQDFQKEVAKKRLPRSAAGSRSGRSPTKHRLTLSVDAIQQPKEPLTAPLPDENGGLSPAPPERSPMHSRNKSTPNLEAISPGPSSAPSSFSWSEKEDENDPGKFGRFNPVEMTLNPPKLFEPNSCPGFPPSSSSFFKPPPSPGFAPSHDFKPPPSPGFFSPRHELRPPPSPAFPPSDQFKPPPSSGFPPSDQFRSPPSPGFPSSDFFKPPPSPSFRAHRFGGGPQSMGFSSLNLGSEEFTCARLDKGSMSMQMPTPMHRAVSITRALPDDDALMSPRAETMTNNPLHESFGELAGMKFVEVPPTPTSEGLFSPRQTMFPRDPFYPFGRPTQIADPRSPPTKGETPIVRSIDEML